MVAILHISYCVNYDILDCNDMLINIIDYQWSIGPKIRK